MIKDKRYYLDNFKVDEPMLDRLIATALSSGGSYADLYFEYTTYNELSMIDSTVNRGGFHEDYGVGIRVLDGEKTGYAYSESTIPADMMAAARAASAIAGNGRGGKAFSVTAGNGRGGKAAFCKGMPAGTVPCDGENSAAVRDFYPWLESWRDCPNSRLLPLMTETDRLIRSREPRVSKLNIRFSASESDVLMYNSLRELRWDSRPMYNLSVVAVFSDGKGGNVSTSASRSFRKGAEGLVTAGEMADLILKDLDLAFEARRPKGGQMPVVMGAGASGILLHEAMGHAFEADFIRKGSSIFKDRLGERICPAGINIVDDGTLAGNRGSGNYDDEGVAGQKTWMVRDGRLESYLHDRISAAHFGVEPTGNGRREDFRCEPIPRMRATYMENGDCRPEDIIASVKKGIYVDEFSNGQVRIGEGDFTFFVKRGRLIEDGRLTMPVKDINIIGNGPEALSRIEMVGNDAAIEDSSWTCGKGQNVPVSCGMPSVLVGGLTVGGE